MRKKYLGFICLLYSLIIIRILYTDTLKNFLAPSMHIYIKISVFVLFFMGIVILFSKSFHYKFKITDLLLLIPLIMLFVCKDGRISLSIANNRTNIKKEKVVNNIKKKKDDSKINVEDLDFSNPYFDVDDEVYLDLANYLSFNKRAEDLLGKTIKVRGFTVGNNNYLPPNLYGLGKYGVNCCVADAFYSEYVINPGDYKIKGSTWYEVEGYIERNKDINGHDIFIIRVVNIKEIDGSNEEEYVYPCYQYGDGGCQKMKKYNLKY